MQLPRRGKNRNADMKIFAEQLIEIDNETGSGKNADTSNPIVKKYVDLYGFRKVEANAIVVDPSAGQKLCRSAIEKYLGPGALDRFEDLKDKTIASYEEVMNDTEIFKPLNNALELLQNVETDDQYDT